MLEKRTELVAKKITEFLKATDRYDKTIVFCEDIDHAERMRQALVNENADLVAENRKYVMRITGDNDEGKAELDNFIHPDERYPSSSTTSKLLTTGVDAQTCKLIVLDQRIRSMTEFKQIIGRGTRINEDFGKFFFTIMDFKKATELFADPDFDGDPVQIYEPKDDEGPVPPDDELEDEPAEDEGGEEPGDEEPGDEGKGGEDQPGGDENGGRRRVKYVVNDVPVWVVAERVQYYGKDGKLITESLKDYSKKTVRSKYVSLDQFLTRWNEADRKQAIVNELGSTGSCSSRSPRRSARTFDPFDLVCHVAFDQPPLTRQERADKVRKKDYFAKYGEQARAVLDALLDKYADEGVGPIEDINVLKVQPLNRLRHADGDHPPVRRQGPVSSRPCGNSKPCSTLRSLQPIENELPCLSSTTIKTIQDIMRKDVGVDGDAQRIGQLVWMLFLKVFDDQRAGVGAARRPTTGRPSRRLSAGANWAANAEGHHRRALLDFVNNQLFPTLKNLPARQQDRPRGCVVRRVFEDAYNYMKSGTLLRQVINKIQDEHRLQRARTTATSSATSTSRSSATSRTPGTPASTTRPAPSPSSSSTRSTRKLGETVLDPACGTGGFPRLRHRARPQAVREDRRRRADAPSSDLRRREEAAPAPPLRHQHDVPRHRRPRADPPRQHAGPPSARLRPEGPR